MYIYGEEICVLCEHTWPQGAHGPPVAMYVHKERRFLHHICTLKRILGDEFLSKFGDFYENLKIPWRNSEPDAQKDGPRSLS